MEKCLQCGELCVSERNTKFIVTDCVFHSAKYPLATVNKLISVHGNNQVIGSDIGCSLSATLAASSIAQMARVANVQLIVNTFHGHAHNRMCQLQYHPLYLPGTGLEDFETCERVFSSSNATAALICHASYFHYIQYLDLHFSQWDADKYAELSTLLLFCLVQQLIWFQVASSLTTTSRLSGSSPQTQQNLMHIVRCIQMKS